MKPLNYKGFHYFLNPLSTKRVSEFYNFFLDISFTEARKNDIINLPDKRILHEPTQRLECSL